MKKKFIICALALTFVLSLNLAFIVFATPDKTGAIHEEQGFTVVSAYNLNLGAGEIKKYSYKNTANEKIYESFGSGYGGYFTTRNRWQEAPVLIETSDLSGKTSYEFGSEFSKTFTFVGRPVQTLYSERGEQDKDYSTLTFDFSDGKNSVRVALSQAVGRENITAEVYYNGYGIRCSQSKVNCSINGKYDGKDYPLYLSFDGENGRIYTRIDDTMSVDSLLCDISAADSSYSPMSYYSASVAFSNGRATVEASDGSTYSCKGRLLVYEVCGQHLTGTASNDKGAVVTCYGNYPKVLTGGDYTPLAAKAYDVLDGDISDSVILTVKDPDGSPVNLVGGYFKATKKGTYTLIYTVKDSGGITSSCEYEVECTDVAPAVICNLSQTYRDYGGIYETVYIIPAEITVDGAAADYFAAVIENGKRIAEYAGGEEGSFSMTAVGEYVIKYYAMTEMGYMEAKSVTVACRNEAGFALGNIPYRISYNVPMDFGEPTVNYNGTSVIPDLEITTPSGKTVCPENFEFTPTEFGEYVFRFYARSNGKTVERIFTSECVFTNYSLIRSVNGFDTKQDDYTVTVYDRKVNESTGAVTKTLTQKSGMLLSGRASDQTFLFANPIDLNEISPTTPIINLFVLSGEYASLTSLEIRLIDKYNTSSYVSVYWNQHSTLDYYNYVRAGANGRQYGRSNEAGSGNKIWPSLFGTVTMNTLNGSKNSQAVYGESKYNTFNFYFDYAERIIRVANARVWNDPEFFTVIDLDDPDMVGSDRWQGFTTGEAYLEVILPGSTATPAGIVVLDVAGQSLGGTVVIDEQPPIITVQTEYLPDDMPDALVGKKYPVPTAYGSDTVCGETQVSVSVKNNNGGELPITDGCVTPGSVGAYTVTYTSTDFYGNETVKVYSFNAVESIEKIRLNWVTEPEPYTAGDTIVVPEIAVSGGSGNIHELQIAIRYNGREIELPVSRILKLTEAGEVTFTILSARDYIGTETDGTTLSFEIAVPEKPTLTVVGVPEAYIVGQTAYLPEYSAIDYRYLSTEAGYNSAVTVKVNGRQVDGKTFVVPDVETITLVFTTGDGNSVAEKTIVVPTVKPNKLADYFTSDAAVSTEITNDGVLFTTTAGNDVTFINPVVFNSFNIGFNIAKTVRCYDGTGLTSKSFNLPTAINVTLTDYYDANYVVKLSITAANSTQSNLQINDRGDKIKIRGSFKAAETELQNYRLLLGADGTLMDIRSSLSFRIGDFMNGEEFNGFPSGLVKVSFGVEGKGSVSLLVNQLGNQIFDYYSYEYGDGTMPMLLTEYPMESGVRLKGEQIVISAAKAYDVLNVYGTVTLRVTAPDGNGSQKLLYDGIVPENTIVLDAEYYGNYSAEYTLRDENGNYGKVTYIFPVRDTVAPTITVNGTVKTEYKVGEQMIMPEIFVTSSLDIAPVYYVMIYNRSTRYERVTGTSVTLKKGDFKLVIYAYDSDFNVAVKEYEFNVR